MCKIKQIIFEEQFNEQDDELLYNLAKVISILYNFIEENFSKTSLSSKILEWNKIKNNDDIDQISRDIILYSEPNDIVLKTENELFNGPLLVKNFPSLDDSKKQNYLNQDKQGKYFVPSLSLIKRNKIDYSLKIEKFELVEFNLKNKDLSFVKFVKNKQAKMYAIDLTDISYVFNILAKITQELEN